MAAELQQKQKEQKTPAKAAPVAGSPPSPSPVDRCCCGRPRALLTPCAGHAAKSKTRPFKSSTHGGLPLFLGQFMFLAVAFGGTVAASTVAKDAVQQFAEGVDKKLLDLTLPTK